MESDKTPLPTAEELELLVHGPAPERHGRTSRVLRAALISGGVLIGALAIAKAPGFLKDDVIEGHNFTKMIAAAGVLSSASEMDQLLDDEQECPAFEPYADLIQDEQTLSTELEQGALSMDEVDSRSSKLQKESEAMASQLYRDAKILSTGVYGKAETCEGVEPEDAVKAKHFSFYDGILRQNLRSFDNARMAEESAQWSKNNIAAKTTLFAMSAVTIGAIIGQARYFRRLRSRSR